MLRDHMPDRDARLIASLTPDERAYYEKRLQEAMRLYYARAYRAALPLFAEVALRVDTLDVLYWLGMSAYYGGRPDIAAARFRQILRQYPDFHQGHLYLAMALAALGRFDEAEKELQLARRSLHGESWKEAIARIENQWLRARLFNHLRFRAGFHYDTNPAAKPDIDFFPTPTGALVRVGKQPEGWFSQVNLSDEIYYDAFGRGGFGWRGRLDFLANLYMGDDAGVDLAKAFDYYQWQTSFGPDWTADRYHGDGLIHVGQRFFGQDHLSDFTGIAPVIAFRVLPGHEAYGGYRFQYEWFDGNRQGQDYTQHIGFLGWRARLGDHLLSLSGDGGRRHARDRVFGYWEGGVNLDWYGAWPLGLESHVGVSYHRREYDSPFTLVAFKDRSEDRFYSNLTVTKRFAHGLFVEARWDFFLNQANIELYDYQRHVVGFNVGIDFSL